MDDLSKEISDKLDFLEISRKNLSQLQILLIETEVRRGRRRPMGRRWGGVGGGSQSGGGAG